MKQAFVAIVGEPNVGKSTIINKILAQRVALTSAVAGTTRDRFYAPTSWNAMDFVFIDTAGIVPEQRDELEKNVQKQVDVAIKQADLILYVIDGKKDPQSFNRIILQKLRKSKKEIVLAINKVDSPKLINSIAGEYKFTGIKDIVAMSAVSGVGTGDMLDIVTDKLKKGGFDKIEKPSSDISVAIVGKPNVGKSSLFNRIIGEERVVVSNMPMTTRNVIDTEIVYKDKKIKFLDTAGLKKKEKRAPLPDIYAAFQTIRAIHNSHLCILVIDAKAGITQQDQHIAGDIIDAGKGLIVVANKVDLLTEKERELLEKQLPHYFEFLWWAPAVPASAETGDGIKDILNYIMTIEDNRNKVIDPEALNKFFHAKLKIREPIRIRDERIPKVFKLTQFGSNPPIFKISVNEPSAISMQWRKFIQNAIIKELGFWGTPIILKLEAKRGNPNFN